MKKTAVVILVLAVVGIAWPAKAQDQAPKAELYAGYDYVLVNSAGDGYNFNGGSGQFAYNVNRWLGVVGDFGGYYTGGGFGGAGVFSYLFGPRVNLRGHGRITPFVQALFGGARDIAASPTQNVFAMTAGGGVDFKVSEHFSVRPVQAEYFLTQFTNGTNKQQNSFRYSAGIVFRF
jgi:opacity protein-like surface antigen